MPLDSVRVKNFRSIADSGEILLGPVTVLIGPNNAGKSALLRAIYMLQGGATRDDIRVGTRTATVDAKFTPPHPSGLVAALDAEQLPHDETILASAENGGGSSNGARVNWPSSNSGRAARYVSIPNARPEHMFVPMFARRKSNSYETAVRPDLANTIDVSDRRLTSRIASLIGDHAEGRRYREIVERVLGLRVSTFLTADGQTPGVPLSSSDGIAMTAMGEGVSSVVGLAAELVEPGTKVFLLEEPENDLHPLALRALLDEIKTECDRGHQFVVTTHSDIVLRELGAMNGSRIYRAAASSSDMMPETQYFEVSDSFEREEALRSLGYEQTSPFGWLVLEESSAETFIGGALIPLFAPKLGALRTVSAGGTGNLSRTTAALHSMILFAHLKEAGHRAWVLADGDESGRQAVTKLRESFKTWPPDRFRTFGRPRIEDYYPDRFRDRVAELEGHSGTQAMSMKGALAQTVREWALTDRAASGELSESAANLIDLLREIEAALAHQQK